MARSKKKLVAVHKKVEDFRHVEAQRRNNPPAGMASTYEVRERQIKRYAYDPHLDPQLVWAGKAEQTSFDVEVVPLHIHERISTRAILDAVRRPQGVSLELFGETPLPADKQIEFYQHDVGWANRLILGDSLLVMNSLLVKEGMAGKVQMIYMDPPYGIKYSSNFQPRIDRRDVKDRDEDLTHEPEQIKAYRDTWQLGIHSYLTYLRDRLLLCRELLHESGSIFVQINDENLHLVRCLLDEVFGRENFVALIAFRKKQMPLGAYYLDSISDYLIWYSKNKTLLKYRQIFLEKSAEGDPAWGWVILPDYTTRRLTHEEINNHGLLPKESRLFQSKSLRPAGFNQSCVFPIYFQGRRFDPSGSWVTNEQGMRRIIEADRIIASDEGSIRYTLLFDDYPVTPLSNMWTDTGGVAEKLYAVQTSEKIIERCILMTTDPGDLVFDPTCGSGTTAYCAEKWGRRWITCDTSRVAIAIARQRLMTAKFDYYELKDSKRGPAGGFNYETVPHITLESIARNTEIDTIAAKYQPQIDQALADLNRVLGRNWKEWEVPREIPHPLWPEEARKAYWRLIEVRKSPKKEEAARLLETIYKQTGHRWELEKIPEPIPPENWPEDAKEAFHRFWMLKRKKRREIDESIQRNAPQEVLYDRPKIVNGVIRVSGPFTVEAIPLPAVEDPQALLTKTEVEEAQIRVNDLGGDYITTMINLLKQQGSILFPGGKKLELKNIRTAQLGYIHAEAEANQNGDTMRVAISFGPKHGPLVAHQVLEAIPVAKANGYNILIFAGFAFDPEAQSLIQKVPVKGLQVQFANISPDVLVGDLLKTTRASQIFSVFGQPDIKVEKQTDNMYTVKLLGVDIYDPLTGEVQSTSGENVAAWFLDTDYDGRTFHICQAFFPGDPNAWEKLQRALKAYIDPKIFEKMKGTTSLPFKAGEHMRVAVKVIDFRGNEVIRVSNLERGELDRDSRIV
jgi:adenine-specific DNA-methyltransferase